MVSRPVVQPHSGCPSHVFAQLPHRHRPLTHAAWRLDGKVDTHEQSFSAAIFGLHRPLHPDGKSPRQKPLSQSSFLEHLASLGILRVIMLPHTPQRHRDDLHDASESHTAPGSSDPSHGRQRPLQPTVMILSYELPQLVSQSVF